MVAWGVVMRPVSAVVSRVCSDVIACFSTTAGVFAITRGAALTEAERLALRNQGVL